jgi:hypothetical protein
MNTDLTGSAQSDRNAAKSAAINMEDDLTEIRNLAWGIYHIAGSLPPDDDYRLSIQTISIIIIRKLDDLEELRLRAAGQKTDQDEKGESHVN